MAVRMLRSSSGNSKSSGRDGDPDDPGYWAKADMELPERTIQSFLFAAKFAMVEWGWPKRALWADPITGTLSLAKETVLTAVGVNDKVVIKYEAGWETYFEDPNFPKIKELVQTAGEKMAKRAGN